MLGRELHQIAAKKNVSNLRQMKSVAGQRSHPFKPYFIVSSPVNLRQCEDVGKNQPTLFGRLLHNFRVEFQVCVERISESSREL